MGVPTLVKLAFLSIDEFAIDTWAPQSIKADTNIPLSVTMSIWGLSANGGRNGCVAAAQNIK